MSAGVASVRRDQVVGHLQKVWPKTNKNSLLLEAIRSFIIEQQCICAAKVSTFMLFKKNTYYVPGTCLQG